MQIIKDFIATNPRIEIISNDGEPTAIPHHWEPVLGADQLLVAVPDMHMFLHDSNQDNFKYGAESMIAFLEHVRQVKRELSSIGRTLQLVQLGDMFELRFPVPGTSQNPSVGEIVRSHVRYEFIAETMKSLGAKFLVGNHDYEQRQQPNVHEAISIGSVYMEHGYSADRWYHFANPQHSMWHPTMYLYKQLRRVESLIHRARVAVGHLEEGAHAAVGVLSGRHERHDFPPDTHYPRHQLQYFGRLLAQHRKHARRTRICIIGHTHHPHIRTSFADGERIFVDAGCWTNGRSDFVVVTNRELAICRYKRLGSPARALAGDRLVWPSPQLQPAIPM